MSIMPSTIKLLVFREVLPGDIKKHSAKSNVSQSGGGARDLRFRGTQWVPFLSRMFPMSTGQSGVSSATVHWFSLDKSAKSATVEWWRPTYARPGETRIGRINQITAWSVNQVEFFSDKSKGIKWFFVLFLDEKGFLWASLVRQSDLNKQAPQIKEFVEEVIRATPSGRTVAGAKDFSAEHISVNLGLTQAQLSVLNSVTDDEKLSSKKLAQIDDITRDKDLEKLILEWSNKNKGKTPKEIRQRVTRLKRCVALVVALKKKYGYKCQVMSCGFTFRMSNGGYYCEAAHINPISRRKAGLDTSENILILCPNHHKMLDYGAMRIISSIEVEIEGKICKLNRK